MCDTMCIMSDKSCDGISYFAKNSDRSPNEPLLTLSVPAATHAPGSSLRCTYIEIPQVEHTRAVVISKPSWMWGAEMGINDARVAIGNEAVFTKAKRGEDALIGMDLLRLGLERAASARAAAMVIVELLEAHGQGGNCGFDKEFHYDNSFLISDPRESFVLETSGKNYALHEVEGSFAISNRLCLGADNVSQVGLDGGKGFAQAYLEPVRSFFAQGKARREQAVAGIESAAGDESCAAGLLGVLRTHAPGFDGREFNASSVGSVCMHAGSAIGDHTTGSVIYSLREDKPVTMWMTGCSTPCVSTFKPLFWDGNVSPVASAPLFDDTEEGSAASLDYWLQREHLHRAIIAGKVDVAALRTRQRALEASWLAEETALMAVDVPDMDALRKLSKRAATEEQALIDEFSVGDWQTVSGKGGYGRYWNKKNEKLGQPRT